MPDELVEQQQTAEATPAPVDKIADSPPAAPAEPIKLNLSEALQNASPEIRRQWEATGDDSLLLPKDKPAEANAANEPEAAPGKETEPKSLSPEERSRRDKERGDKRQHEYWRDRAVEERTRREQLEREIAELKSKGPESAPGKPAETPSVADGIPELVLPDIADFETTAAWNKAVSKAVNDHNRTVAQLLVQQELQKHTREQQLSQTQQEAERREKTWSTRLDEGSKKYPDFSVAYDAPLTHFVLEELKSREDGADLLYWLGQNPDEAKRIADATILRDYDAILKRDPDRAAELRGEMRALARTELRNIAERLKKAPQPKKHTSAPPPVRPADGRSQVIDDPVEAAFQAGDMKTWERLANERDLRKLGFPV